jgi:hypothetical protein
VITLVDWNGASISYRGTLSDAINLFKISQDCYWKVCVDSKTVAEWKLIGDRYECIYFKA